MFYSCVLTVFKLQLLEALHWKLDIFSTSFIVDLFIPLVYRYSVTTVGFLVLEANVNVQSMSLGNFLV